MALFPRKSALQRSYDAIAAEYARRHADTLEALAAERELLDRFAEALADAGPCLDLGCGPGYFTRYLHERGVEISGIDISAAMVKQARKLHPGIHFERGDMRDLKADDNGLAAVVSLYTLKHVPGQEIQDLLLEFRRVLEPGGALLLAFHTGEDSLHLDEWWGARVDVDIHLHRLLDVVIHMQQAGFREVSMHRRRIASDGSPPRECAWLLAEALPGVPPARRSSAILT